MGGRRWTEDEMLVAIFLYRFGRDSLGVPQQVVAKAMGRSADALELRLLDLASIDKGDESLAGFGQSSPLREVWNRAKDLPRDLLAKRVRSFLKL